MAADDEKALDASKSANGSSKSKPEKGTPVSESEPEKKPGSFSTLLNSPYLSWIKPALTNKRTLKTWFRCIAVLISVLVLMVDQTTLNSMGNAAFFCVIVAFMLPPAMAFSLYLLASLTLIFGMMLGWAWGAAAMAAANAARSQSLLASQNQVARTMINPNSSVPIALQQQSIIFHGVYLDPRSSAVYGAFFFVGSYFLGVIRAKIPGLALLGIFGTIVLTVMCSYGPPLPTPQYTITTSFVIPALYCIAISLASLFFIFPESMNHIWLTKFGDKAWKPVLEILDVQSKGVTSDPNDMKRWKTLLDQGMAARRSLVMGLQELKKDIGMIDLEVSIGRLGPTDLQRVAKELDLFISRVSALMSFQNFYYERNKMHYSGEDSDEEKGPVTSSPHAFDRSVALNRRLEDLEKKHDHGITDMLPSAAELTSDLRKACKDGTIVLREWFRDCNTERWTRWMPAYGAKKKEERKKRIEERRRGLVNALAGVEKALETFKSDRSREMLRPYEKFFDGETGELIGGKIKFSTRALFLCFVFTESLEGYAEALISLLKVAVDLDAKRPEPKIWVPSGLAKCGQRLLQTGEDRSRNVDPLAAGSPEDPTQVLTTSSSSSESTLGKETDEGEEEEDMNEPAPRNPDALPPKTAMGRFFRRIGNFVRFTKSAEGVFALRHAVVSVALWIPAVCTTSTWFNYENRGLWALIMAQVTLAVYAGDQIMSVVLRFAATCAGLLIGMAVWYISSGVGPGNPYGVVAATTVFSAPFLLGRIAAPPQLMMVWVLCGVTIIFVVGYSWVDNHIVMLANAGVGVSVAWKRVLLVAIGFVAASIAMLFPRYSSARTMIRRTLGCTTQEFGHIYKSLIEVLLAEERMARDGKVSKPVSDGEGEKLTRKQKKLKQISGRLLAVAMRLQAMAPSLQTAKWEPQLQGKWPGDEYGKIYALQTKLLATMALLLSTLSRLDTRWCSIIVRRSPHLNPNFLSDVFSSFTLVSESLRGPQPLPTSAPILRDRVVYHERHTKAHGGHAGLIKHDQNDAADTPTEDGDSEDLRVDGTTTGIKHVTFDIFKDDQFPVHSTALVGLSSVITLLDDLSMMVGELCGRTHFRGFDHLRESYLTREEEALGKKDEFYV